jgi:hypothetical protein
MLLEATTKAEAVLNSLSSSVLSTPSQSMLLETTSSSPQEGAARGGVSGRGGEREAAVGEAGGERMIWRLSSLKATTMDMSLATRKAKMRPMAGA